MTERIDAHHHVWRYHPAEYGWISPDMIALRRDFLPADLENEMHHAGLNGAVAVQARQTLEETNWLLSLAENSAVMKGVVGWAPVADCSFPRHLERLRANSKLKGLRHLIQDEPDPAFLQREDFNRGIALLSGAGLVYDLLVFEKQLASAIEFVDRHPQQVFVLDHIGKPRIKEGVLDPWRRHIAEIAHRENVYCKFSGLVTEADWSHWTPQDLQPYFDAVLKAFGPRRIMAGSDWPVCLLATTYRGWFDLLHTFVQPLSKSEQEMILGGVATRVYSLHD